MITISGPAGIGKSRLVHEAPRIAESKGFTVVTVSCGRDSPYPYAPFRELAERLRRIPDSPPNPFHDERTMSSKDGILLAWESYLGKLSRQRPVLIILDDLQKADSSSVRLLDYLLRSGNKEGPVSSLPSAWKRSEWTGKAAPTSTISSRTPHWTG